MSDGRARGLPKGGERVLEMVQSGYGGTQVSSVVLPLAPTDGNTLVLFSNTYNSAYLASVSQTGVTWESAARVQYAFSGARLSLWLGYAGPGAITTVTCPKGANGYQTVRVIEMAGLWRFKTGYSGGVGWHNVAGDPGDLLVACHVNSDTRYIGSLGRLTRPASGTYTTIDALSVPVVGALASIGTGWAALLPEGGAASMYVVGANGTVAAVLGPI